MTPRPYSVSEVAALLSSRLRRQVRPRDVTDILYSRAIPESFAPIATGRRLICPEALTLIEDVLESRRERRRGKHGN